MKRKYLYTILALAAMGVVSFGTIQAMAHDATGNGKTLVQAIAEKFNLKESDVQQVVDDHKTQVQATLQQRIDDKLTQAVTDKKITEDQKQKIIAKQKELQTERATDKEKLKAMTPTERKTELENQRAALEQWAKDNGIDVKYLRPGLIVKGRKGRF